MAGYMNGKRGLIMGLANDKSLAWGIAKKLKEEGAELAFSYQGEVMEKRVRPLAEQPADYHHHLARLRWPDRFSAQRSHRCFQQHGWCRRGHPG